MSKTSIQSAPDLRSVSSGDRTVVVARFGKAGGDRAEAGGTANERVIGRLLDAPFPASRLKLRLSMTNNDAGKGLVTPYIDARDVEERLDQVLGKAGWETKVSHLALPNGKARTTVVLRAKIGDTWVERSAAAGDRSEDAAKSAVSEALKIAACQLGVGRCVYDLPKPYIDCQKTGRGKLIIPKDYRYQLPDWWLLGCTAPDDQTFLSAEDQEVFDQAAGVESREDVHEGPSGHAEDVPDFDPEQDSIVEDETQVVAEAPPPAEPPQQVEEPHPAKTPEARRERVTPIGRSSTCLEVVDADGVVVTLGTMASSCYATAKSMFKGVREKAGGAGVLAFIETFIEQTGVTQEEVNACLDDMQRRLDEKFGAG